MGQIKQPGVSNSRGRCRIRFILGGTAYSETFQDLSYSKQADINEAARRLQKRKQAASIADVSAATPAGSFGNAAQRWLDTADIAPSHRATAKNRLNRWWVGALGETSIDAIRTKDLRLVLAQTKHLAPKTRRNILSDVSAVFQSALADGLIETNPARSVVLPRHKDRAKPDPFTPEERDAILAKLDGVCHAYWAIRFYAGLRPGECLALTRSDLLQQPRRIVVNKQVVAKRLRRVTKTYEVREVPVVRPLELALRGLPLQLHTEILLTNQYGRRYTSADKLNAPFLQVLKDLNIRYRSPYNARHTCATVMLIAGMEPAKAAKIMGHSTKMFLDTYSDWIPNDRDQEELDKWEAMF